MWTKTGDGYLATIGVYAAEAQRVDSPPRHPEQWIWWLLWRDAAVRRGECASLVDCGAAVMAAAREPLACVRCGAEVDPVDRWSSSAPSLTPEGPVCGTCMGNR